MPEFSFALEIFFKRAFFSASAVYAYFNVFEIGNVRAKRIKEKAFVAAGVDEFL